MGIFLCILFWLIYFIAGVVDGVKSDRATQDWKKWAKSTGQSVYWDYNSNTWRKIGTNQKVTVSRGLDSNGGLFHVVASKPSIMKESEILDIEYVNKKKEATYEGNR